MGYLFQLINFPQDHSNQDLQLKIKNAFIHDRQGHFEHQMSRHVFDVMHIKILHRSNSSSYMNTCMWTAFNDMV